MRVVWIPSAPAFHRRRRPSLGLSAPTTIRLSGGGGGGSSPLPLPPPNALGSEPSSSANTTEDRRFHRRAVTGDVYDRPMNKTHTQTHTDTKAHTEIATRIVTHVLRIRPGNRLSKQIERLGRRGRGGGRGKGNQTRHQLINTGKERSFFLFKKNVGFRVDS